MPSISQDVEHQVRRGVHDEVLVGEGIRRCHVPGQTNDPSNALQGTELGADHPKHVSGAECRGFTPALEVELQPQSTRAHQVPWAIEWYASRNVRNPTFHHNRLIVCRWSRDSVDRVPQLFELLLPRHVDLCTRSAALDLDVEKS